MEKRRFTLAALAAIVVLTLLMTGSEAGRSKVPAADPAITYVDGERLLVMNADGTNRAQILEFSEYIYYPNWSPDGGKIVFLEDAGDLWSIEVKILRGRPRGYNLTCLTNSPGSFKYPRWSPSGSVIAVESGYDICTIPASGGSTTVLYDGTTPTKCPTWSPDGKKIAFLEQYRDGAGPSGLKDQVRILEIATGKILKTIKLDLRPRVSYMEWARTRDTLILEQGYQSSSFNNVFHTLDLTTGVLATLMTSPGVGRGRPSWSPDDEKILFHTQDAFYPGPYNNRLLIYDLKSKKTTTLIQEGVDPDWKR